MLYVAQFQEFCKMLGLIEGKGCAGNVKKDKGEMKFNVFANLMQHGDKVRSHR